MTEFKVSVEDDVVAAMGQEKIEYFLRYMIEQLHLKAAARHALDDLKEIDLKNDPQWKQAREAAWNKYVNKDR